MPIYVFKCKECGTTMEILQKYDDPNPVCGCGYEMNRQISKCSFKLKGTGWYATDYSENTMDKRKYGNTKEGQSRGIPTDI